MTSHVLDADHAHTATAPVSVVRQILDAVRSVIAAPTAAPGQNHPCLNATIQSNMSSRAQRLMRSDY